MIGLTMQVSLNKILGRFGLALAMFPIVVIVISPESAFAAKKGTPSFFNSVEVQSSNLEPFKKWRSALKRYSFQTKNEKKRKRKAKCDEKRLNICGNDDWAKFLLTLEGKGKLAQIRAVNRRMNKAKYITDKTNWGRKDYWATPGEFMANFGDCEDFAIIKYMSLRKLGFEESELRVVAVKDLNLKVGHAVLVVFWLDPKSKKKRALLLDNQIKKVVDARAVRHYQPIFSINKDNWWRHRT